jgi:Flp pilus assembly pilin Flp
MSYPLSELEAMSFCFTFFADDNGATSVEYCVCLSLIIVACIGAVAFFGARTNEVWQSNASKISAIPN